MSPGPDWLHDDVAADESPDIPYSIVQAQARLGQIEMFRGLFASPEWPSFAAHLRDLEADALEALRKDGASYETTVAARARANVLRELQQLPAGVGDEIDQLEGIILTSLDPAGRD